MTKQIKGGAQKIYSVKTRKKNFTQIQYFMDLKEAERYAKKHKTVVI